MTCPRCQSGAVVAFPMRYAPDSDLRTCSACGLRWSDEPCKARECPNRATGRCLDCQGFKCDRHGGRERICDACRKRLQAIVRHSRPVRTAGIDRSLPRGDRE